jgi:hypothetical protein
MDTPRGRTYSLLMNTPEPGHLALSSPAHQMRHMWLTMLHRIARPLARPLTVFRLGLMGTIFLIL